MNNDRTLEIERYLGGDMLEEEKQGFEAELSSNAGLRTLLETYRTIDTEMRNTQKYSDGENALRKTLAGLNKTHFFSEAPTRSQTPVIAISAKTGFLKIAVSIAAGLLLILSAYFLFFNSKADTTELANNFVNTELSHLSQTMDGAKDSLQQGIAAYNKKDYPRAIGLFEAVYEAHPENSDALRYAGTAYLVTKQYDKAIEYFDALAAKQLFSNHGLFLKAVTLLQRNQTGDKEKAKELLQQVVNQKTEGNATAEEWLQNWK